MAYGVTSTTTNNLINFVANRAKKLVPQELRKSWIWQRMASVGNYVDIRTPMEQPLYTDLPQGGKWFQRGDNLPDGPGPGGQITSVWQNKYAVVPMMMDLLEQWEQEGDPGLIFKSADLRSMEMAWSFRRLLASGLVNGTGGRQPEGLMYMFEKVAPASQAKTIGGISKASKAFWRHQYVSLASPFGYIAPGTSIMAGLLALQQLKDICTVQALVPSDLLTTQATFRLAKRAMQEMSMQYHMITQRDTAQYGFESLIFDGSYLGWDPNLPADTVLALHLEQKFDPKSQNGDPRDNTKLDTDLESLGSYPNILQMNGSIGLSKNPNISMRRIDPRNPLKQLSQAEWMIHAFNVVCARQSENGSAGSTSGNYWETWS